MLLFCFRFLLRTSKIPARIMQISERFSSCFQEDHDGNLKIRATLRQQRNDSLNRSSANAPHSTIVPTLKWHPHVITALFSRDLCFFRNSLRAFLFWSVPAERAPTLKHRSQQSDDWTNFTTIQSIKLRTAYWLKYNFYNFCSNRLFSLAADAIWLCFFSSST